MIVFYRLCNIPSTNPSPIYQEDKFKLNKLCLKSFVLAFREVKPKIIFLADYCGREYEEMIKEVVPFEYEVHFTALGINGTALLQYEMAKKKKDGVILFQECDYIYRPSVGAKMKEAISKFGLVSPYDHPDFYERYDIHQRTSKIEVLGDQHYRTATRNTMTFGMTHEAFLTQYEILKKYGYLDNEVWHEMKANNQELYVPIPAFATHMVEGLLSHGIPWQSIIQIFNP